jgi:hypothetical protein
LFLAKSFLESQPREERQFLTTDGSDIADKRESREAQGCAWASQAAMDFHIPSQASLRGIVKNPSLILLRKWPCDASSEIFQKKHRGCACTAKRGDVVKKHPQVGLRVSYQQQIQHSRSE